MPSFSGRTCSTTWCRNASKAVSASSGAKALPWGVRTPPVATTAGGVRHYPLVSHDPEDAQGGGTGELGEGATMADPRRMTPEEHGQAHALLVTAVTDPDWQAASQALDDLMGKLLVVRRLLEAEERLPQRAPRRNG
jgi:hypothetical protein